MTNLETIQREKDRKYNYWRGVKATLIVISLLIVIGFIVWANIFIALNS